MRNSPKFLLLVFLMCAGLSFAESSPLSGTADIDSSAGSEGRIFQSSSESILNWDLTLPSSPLAKPLTLTSTEPALSFSSFTEEGKIVPSQAHSESQPELFSATNGIRSGRVIAPEPSTLTLLGTGLAGLVGFLRRKRFT